MCSIDGFTGSNHPFSIQQYAKFNQDRGPDGTNFWSDGHVHMAHSLLAISPNPTSIKQPIVDSKGGVFAWNGEIYGLPEGTFDTKWISDLICDVGIQELKYDVNGMWAFVYYEPSRRSITLARDHFGVKPLYYMEYRDNLYWASTPKPLYAVLQAYGDTIEMSNSGTRYFNDNDRFIVAPHTPFQYIKCLGPGEIIRWDLSKQKPIKLPSDTFFGRQVTKFNLFPDYGWDPDEFREIMKDSIREVCTAKGVRKAISLSGGLDSTLIASLNKHQDNLFTSSLRFEDRKNYHQTTNSKMFDESKMAADTSHVLNIEHHSVELAMDYNNLTQEAYYQLGVPMWDRARVVPRYANILNAKRHNAKIYIVGDMADELCTGYSGDYYYYTEDDRRSWLDRSRWVEWIQSANKFSGMQSYFPHLVMKDDGVNNRAFLRMLQHGPGFCSVTDHLCGSQGIESRVPFLHQKLAKYLLKVPSADKLRLPRELKNPERDRMMGIYKWMIREEMSEFIPTHIETRETKAGFAAPWNSRDKELNNKIGEEDMALVRSLAHNFYKFDLDFPPDFSYNNVPFQYDMEHQQIIEMESMTVSNTNEVSFDEQ